jgi:copper chaperone CopZ
MQKMVLMISGMDCAACVINIDGVLEDTEGIKSAKTNYAKGKAEVEFDEKKVAVAKIISIIKESGYEATVA